MPPSDDGDPCTVWAAFHGGMPCQPGTWTRRSKNFPAAVAGSISSAGVPQPVIGRCWNKPIESRLFPTRSCGYANDSRATARSASLSCRPSADPTRVEVPSLA
jgi:hypothetical protein